MTLNYLSTAVVMFFWYYDCFLDPFKAALSKHKTNSYIYREHKGASHLFPSFFPPHHSNTFLLDQKKEERSILDVAMETEKDVRMLKLKPDV